ncbi:hypothetical protein GCM10023096_34490 [Nonomuraea ferruginea]
MTGRRSRRTADRGLKTPGGRSGRAVNRDLKTSGGRGGRDLKTLRTVGRVGRGGGRLGWPGSCWGPGSSWWWG